MTLLLMTGDWNPRPFIDEIRHLDPSIPIEVWPDVSNPENVQLVLAWKHRPNELHKYPRLKGALSLGHGVNHLLADPSLANIALGRIIDPTLVDRMCEYAVAAVIDHRRHFSFYRAQQGEKRWKKLPARGRQELGVGVMGLGEIGIKVAQSMHQLGYRVSGWSLNHKSVEGIATFAGPSQLQAFLASSDELICLLPLTEETRGILCSRTFEAMPKGAWVVNLGRGEHLVEEDLLTALENGHLEGAWLDAFAQEPLPPDSLLWENPRIVVTPHVGGVTDPAAVAKQIADDYRRIVSGGGFHFPVDRRKGY